MDGEMYATNLVNYKFYLSSVVYFTFVFTFIFTFVCVFVCVFFLFSLLQKRRNKTMFRSGRVGSGRVEFCLS